MAKKPMPMAITVNAKGEVISKDKPRAIYKIDKINEDVTLELAYIPMGSTPFFIGKYPVTQAQWEAVMGNNPSFFKGKNYPVEKVTYGDAIEFCQRLSEKVGKEYRLPTQAEWEYACRSGTTTPYSVGVSITTKLVNYNPYGDQPSELAHNKTTKVGSYPPNFFGLYDMHGNVWEWVANGTFQERLWCRCGGAWNCVAIDCCSISVACCDEYFKFWDTGFRVAKSLGSTTKTGKKPFFSMAYETQVPECDIKSQFTLV